MTKGYTLIQFVIHTALAALMAILLYYAMTDMKEFQKTNKIGRELTV